VGEPSAKALKFVHAIFVNERVFIPKTKSKNRKQQIIPHVPFKLKFAMEKKMPPVQLCIPTARWPERHVLCHGPSRHLQAVQTVHLGGPLRDAAGLQKWILPSTRLQVSSEVFLK